MRHLFRSLFHIYPDELRRAFLFAFLGFLWAFAATSALKFADALFLLNVGADSLPKAYTLTSCGMIGIASILLYAFHHYSAYQIYRTTLCIAVGFYSLVLSLVIFSPIESSSIFWYALKIGGFFLFAVLMTSYWTFIDQYHHLQDAKRLYSLFSSTVFLGSATTGIVMHMGILSLQPLIVFILCLLSATLCWVTKINNEMPTIPHEEETEPEPTQGALRHLIQGIFSSRFTLLLIGSNFLIYLLLVTTEYNYMATFSRAFATIDQGIEVDATPEAPLTLFLGRWLSIVSGFNLLVGLFVYSRLIRRFGIHALLFVTPTLLLIAFTGWSFASSLLFPLIGFFVVEGTLYVIDDSNFTLLLNAVPSQLKNKIRVMVESFFEPVGMLASSLLLTLFPSHTKVLGLILTVLLMVVAFALSHNYLRAIFLNLKHTVIPFHRKAAEVLATMDRNEARKAKKRLLHMLRIGDSDTQIFAFETLLAFGEETMVHEALHLSHSMPYCSKKRVLALFAASRFDADPILIETIQRWLYEEYASELKGEVHFYLAQRALLHPEKALQDLKEEDPLLQGAAILALHKPVPELSPSTIAHHRALAAQHLRSLLDSPHEEELAMGLSILGIQGESEDIDLLLPYLTHPSPRIAKTAAKAIVDVGSFASTAQAARVLATIHQSSDPEIRLYLLQALRKASDSSLIRDLIVSSTHFLPSERRAVEGIVQAIGLRTVPTLLSIVKESSFPDHARLLAGKILGKLALPQLRLYMPQLVEEETARALFYFCHARALPTVTHEIDTAPLQEALLTGYQSVLDFIVQLLGIAGEVEDEELLSRSLRSAHSKTRSRGVEALQKSVSHDIFRLLQPLIDEIPDTEKIRAYIKSGHHLLSLEELLDRMESSSAQIDRIVAIAFKRSLNLPSWKRDLYQQMQRDDPLFYQFAYELLDTCNDSH